MDLYASGNEKLLDGDVEGAVEDYTAAIAADGSRPEFFMRRSKAFLMQRKYMDAMMDGQKAVELDGSDFRAHKQVGLAAFEADEFETAAEAFKQAASLAGEAHREAAVLKTWLLKCEAEVEDDELLVGDEDDDAADASDAAAAKSASAAAAAAAAAAVSAGGDAPVAPAPSAASSAAAAAAAAAAVPVPAEAKAVAPKAARIRHDWYQTVTHVTISVMIKGADKDAVQADVSSRAVELTVDLGGGSEYQLDLSLADSIDASDYKLTVMRTKIELKLKKSEAYPWPALEASEELPSAAALPRPATDSAAVPAVAVDKTSYPSSSTKKRDWDAVLDEVDSDEEESPEGEAALQKLFRDIYAKADPDTRRAMVKSMQTSGGTVLSTNWSEVKDKDYEKDRTAPDGMEWRKY
eukprot:PLAT3884.1.p1 GENE.PLAT3884.1~~PLAT3884.1.p1  ORF type:complete len:408 (+),score=177.65 PLAT3884.1:59-1282(+)